jgi:hypothetical protein
MPIPDADLAFVPADKISDYLLDEQHPIGAGKAKWFHSLGYDVARPSELEEALRNLVGRSDNFSRKDSPHGVKYVVSASILTPNGKTVNVTTVWIVEPSDPCPRLVTAYPGEKQ